LDKESPLSFGYGLQMRTGHRVGLGGGLCSPSTFVLHGFICTLWRDEATKW